MIDAPGRRERIENVVIVVQRQSELFEIILAGLLNGLLASMQQSRQGQCKQQTASGGNDERFDECKTA
jgi:hypothetical protein